MGKKQKPSSTNQKQPSIEQLKKT